MKRRGFFGWLLGGIVAGRVALNARPLGYMDVNRWNDEGRRVRGDRVFIDGRDITNRCRWFDDTTGEVYCFKHGPDGRPYRDPDHRDQAAHEILRGRVTVIQGNVPSHKQRY
jgi:hypothetical protein